MANRYNYRRKGSGYSRNYRNRDYSYSNRVNNKDGIIKSAWITRVEEREGQKGKYYLVRTKKYSYYVPAEDKTTVLAILNRKIGEYNAINGRLTWRGPTGKGKENYELILKGNTEKNNEEKTVEEITENKTAIEIEEAEKEANNKVKVSDYQFELFEEHFDSKYVIVITDYSDNTLLGWVGFEDKEEAQQVLQRIANLSEEAINKAIDESRKAFGKAFLKAISGKTTKKFKVNGGDENGDGE